MKISSLRKSIDKVDERIVKLLNERASLAIEVGRLKTESGELIRAPEREKEIFRKLKGVNEGPLSDNALESIYRKIISASLSLERRFKNKTTRKFLC